MYGQISNGDETGAIEGTNVMLQEPSVDHWIETELTRKSLLGCFYPLNLKELDTDSPSNATYNVAYVKLEAHGTP